MPFYIWPCFRNSIVNVSLSKDYIMLIRLRSGRGRLSVGSMSSTSEASKEATNEPSGPATVDVPQADTDQRTEPRLVGPEDDQMVDDVDPVADPDNADSLNLSSPPDSMSTVSDAVEGPEDEIVVSSSKHKSNAAAAAGAAGNTPVVASENGGPGGAEAMDIDGRRTEGDTEPEQRPKRKRASLYDDLAEEKMDNSILDDTADDLGASFSGTLQSKSGTPSQQPSSAKSVILGYWRESEAPDPDKHVVKGFIDSRDRLRTRIQPHNREGKIVTGSFPLKPGPGGSWVTFHNIVFDDHLLNLDQHQVKEYVKIRTELMARDAEDGSKNNDTLAVQQAIRSCQARGPPPEGALPPLIAYGAVIPDAARISYSRAEKRRRHANANATASASTPEATYYHMAQAQQPLQAAPGPQPVQHAAPQILEDLPGHRPTKILLGYWKDSAEKNLADKHAVFGILGNNDMFRVKVGRETRDGRPMQSNFPQGAGALWINTHQWVREDYLKDLTREEVKEYCRVRQWQFDHGEREADVAENRRHAINEARRRAFIIANKPKTNAASYSAGNSFTDAVLAHETPAHETRQALARRTGPAITPVPSSRQSPQTPVFRTSHRPLAPVDPHHERDPRLERAQNLAFNAVSRIEANQAKVEERDAYAAAHTGHGGGDSFRENIGRLNNVWSAQEAHRIRTGNEDAKIHMGVKYERKQNGPFAGKLVSQGAIISIDGEDYVEYRVLTKPTFI